MKICLCGSMTFSVEMEELGRQLENSGHEVCVPLLRVEAEESGSDRKMSIMEMAVAHLLRRSIYLLFPVFSLMSYKEEIMGMRPIVLEGDIGKIESGV